MARFLGIILTQCVVKLMKDNGLEFFNAVSFSQYVETGVA